MKKQIDEYVDVLNQATYHGKIKGWDIGYGGVDGFYLHGRIIGSCVDFTGDSIESILADMVDAITKNVED